MQVFAGMAIAAVAAATLLAALPARADWDGRWRERGWHHEHGGDDRGDWRRDEWRRDEWRWHHRPYYYEYGQVPNGYGPPVVYAAPPPPVYYGY